MASDVGIDDRFLPSTTFRSQDTLNFISNWTIENQMKLNTKKCNYMIFSRSEEQFANHLRIDNFKLDRVRETKILGLCISDDLSWVHNC